MDKRNDESGIGAARAKGGLMAPAVLQGEPRQWCGQWIWNDTEGDPPQTTLFFRQRVTMASRESQATLHISAAHIYQLYINGRFVGRGPHRSDPRFRYYDSYDIASFLQPGENLIACLVHHMTPASENARSWHLYDGPGGLLAELELGRKVVSSDASWQYAPAPGWHASEIRGHRFHPPIHDVNVLRYAEALHAVLAGKDTLAWRPPICRGVGNDAMSAAPLPAETPRLRPVEHEPFCIESVQSRSNQITTPKWMARGATDQPPIIQPSPEGAWLVFRLPYAMAGSYRLHVRTEGNCRIDVYCGEGAERYLSDRLTVAGECRFEPLDWRGGDQVAVHFCDATAPVELLAFHFIEWRYPYQERGDFHCSDAQLNAVWEAGRRTAWQGTQDHLVDCLWREQALWIEDVAVHGRSIRAAFGDVRPVAKSLRQALRVMDDRGVVPIPGPSGLGYNMQAPVLAWSAQALTLPMTARDCCWYSGDRELMRWCVERFDRLLNFFAGYADSAGLLHVSSVGRPDLGLFGGWNPKLREGVPVTLNSMHVLALQAAADLAEAVDQAQLAQAWRDQAERVRQTLRERFWDQERCVVMDGEHEGQCIAAVSATTNAWAALAGVVPQGHAGAWAEALRRLPEVMPPTTPYDATLLLMAYAELDLDLHAGELLRGYFGSIVADGRRTYPEFWLEHDPSMAGTAASSSCCHAYGTGPVYVCQEYILGVRARTPGYRDLLIRPRSLGLSAAAGRVPTPAGDVAVAWRHSATCWQVTVDLPPGVEAEVELPRQGWNREVLEVNQVEVWQAPRWTHFPALARRTYQPTQPRVVRHRLTEPGRYVLRLEVR